MFDAYPENVTVLLNEQATRVNIEAALASLTDDNRVKKEDRVLVFFSGHGQTVKLANGGDMGFLIPYDAKVDLAHPENRGPYLASCLPMDHIWSYLQASPAKHSLLLADACYGGLLAKSRALSREKPNAAVIASLLTRPAMQVLTAGSRDEEAFEDPMLGHGAFTYKLLEELRALAAVPDNVFLASELAGALKVSVGNVTNGKQTPQFGNHDNTEGEFIFVSTEARAVPPLAVHPVPPIPTNPERPVLPGGNNSNGGNGRIGQEANTRINPKDGAEMVLIPGGPFLMGDNDRADNPRHTVTLSSYYIYKNLVTIKQYMAFCDATHRSKPSGPGFDPAWRQQDCPMVKVSWYDARAYCDWAGARLPTEAQWEKAARGTAGLKYPWGDAWSAGKLWCSTNQVFDAGSTTAVGRYGVSQSSGCTDMAGNAWQWCSDWYDAGYWSTPLAQEADPENQRIGEKKSRVLRGGSWRFYGPDAFFRCATRFKIWPGFWATDVGFRCMVLPQP